MLGRIRGAAIALGLIAAVPQALTQERIEPALEGEPIPQPRQDTSAEQSQEQAAQQPTEADRLLPALNAIEGAIRDLVTEENAIERDRQEQHEIADLQAQQEMAVWAKGMFWATLAAVLVTAAGVYLIWQTLGHTRIAANAAVDTVDEAKKSTAAAIGAAAAADEANKLHRAIFISEARAELVVDKIELLSDFEWNEPNGILFDFPVCIRQLRENRCPRGGDSWHYYAGIRAMVPPHSAR